MKGNTYANEDLVSFCLLGLRLLGCVVVRTQLRYQLRGVMCGVDRQCARNHQQSLGKLYMHPYISTK